MLIHRLIDEKLEEKSQFFFSLFFRWKDTTWQSDEAHLVSGGGWM